MADTHHPNSPSPSPAYSPSAGHDPHLSPAGGQAYEGTDPDLPARHEQADRKPSVSTVQVGASAAAAVTSALAASFFGVAGTLIGAAVGSIVSTVAGALYADYMRRAGRRLRTTSSVVIQRIPGDVLSTTPLRHLTGPTDLPGERSLRPVGEESQAQTVAVPVADRTELLAAAATRVEPAAVLPPYRSGGPGGPASRPVHRSRPWYRRPVMSLSAVGLAGFAIALGVVTVSEGALGRPLSGGTGGTSISKFVNAGSNSSDDVTPTPAATPSGSATASPSATTATPSPSATTTAPVAPTTAAATTAPGPTAASTTVPASTEAAASPASTS